jgi:hypothetical protein
VWTYQEDLRPEEIDEIERGDAEKSAQVEEDWAEGRSVEREAEEEARAEQLAAAEADRQAWAGAQAEIRDRVARNTARRSQNLSQESDATL